MIHLSTPFTTKIDYPSCEGTYFRVTYVPITRWNDPEPPSPVFFDGLLTKKRPNSRQLFPCRLSYVQRGVHSQLIRRLTMYDSYILLLLLLLLLLYLDGDVLT